MMISHRFRLDGRLLVGVAALALTVAASPVLAQDSQAEVRLRRVESEVRALQRKVFPDGAGKTLPAEVPVGTPSAVPATTPVTDMLVRMDALEAQVARLTSQVEENGNRISKLEAKVGTDAPASAAPVTGTVAGTAPPPATTPATTAAPAPATVAPRPIVPAPATTAPAVTAPAAVTPAPAPRPAAVATPAPAPSSARLAAVRAIAKPQTEDPGDDEYSYGYRLWEAQFFPEAQQQLKLMIERYPSHARISYARNLLGRAYLDDAKPREAASWFLQNYEGNARGARAADSLLYLAESMRRLNDSKRACIALDEFARTYPAEAVSRLKAQYDQTKSAAKCN